jgi:hypothetical protein
MVDLDPDDEESGGMQSFSARGLRSQVLGLVGEFDFGRGAKLQSSTNHKM